MAEGGRDEEYGRYVGGRVRALHVECCNKRVERAKAIGESIIRLGVRPASRVSFGSAKCHAFVCVLQGCVILNYGNN